jgi:energy-converting hydrogenase Eha subunit A
MPRARNALFEIGGQWISREPGRPGLWRYWYDARTQRVGRKKLGSDDLDAAKLELAKIILTAETPGLASPLSAVMTAYHEGHSDKLRSAKMARTASAKALAFYGATATVADLTERRQAEFVRHLAAAGASLGYIARIVGVIAAGVAYGRIAGLKIFTARDWIAKQAPAARGTRKTAIPTDSQIEACLSAEIPEPLFRWLLISLATGCRPEAALDLTPAQRHDGLLDLNPPGRPQNKKHRPVVREPAFLTPFLAVWAEDASTALYGRYVAYGSVSAVQTALDRLAGALSIKISAYSIRHKVTTVLRRAKRKGVAEDDIAAQLGHKRPNLRVTGEYGEFDPDYLEAATAALDSWLAGLRFSRKTPAEIAPRDGRSGKFLSRSMG